jgi:hypothetical protein
MGAVIPIVTILFIIGIVILFRSSQKQSEVKELEKLKSEKPEEENNFISPANRKFQNINSSGTKITWIFNNDGTKVQIKGGMLGINTINSTLSVQSLGFGRFKSSNGQIFSIERNRIKSGHVYLNEIFD